MVNVPVNFKDLCPSHHRGNGSPHMNKKKDLQYKQELQARLNVMFHKDYYTLNEIKEILEISKSEAEKVVNKTPIFKEGYKREDIIKRCLGGRFY
jgi:predicted XRE-type DNA-binding protein